MKVHRVVVAVVASACLGLAIWSPLEAQSWEGTAAVALRVTDKDGESIAEAQVVARTSDAEALGPPPAATDADGRVVLSGLREGEWFVEVSHQGYMLYAAYINLRAGKKPVVGFSSQVNTATSWAPMTVKFQKSTADFGRTATTRRAKRKPPEVVREAAPQPTPQPERVARPAPAPPKVVRPQAEPKPAPAAEPTGEELPGESVTASAVDQEPDEHRIVGDDPEVPAAAESQSDQPEVLQAIAEPKITPADETPPPPPVEPSPAAPSSETEPAEAEDLQESEPMAPTPAAPDVEVVEPAPRQAVESPVVETPQQPTSAETGGRPVESVVEPSTPDIEEVAELTPEPPAVAATAPAEPEPEVAPVEESVAPGPVVDDSEPVGAEMEPEAEVIEPEVIEPEAIEAGAIETGVIETEVIETEVIETGVDVGTEIPAEPEEAEANLPAAPVPQPATAEHTVEPVAVASPPAAPSPSTTSPLPRFLRSAAAGTCAECQPGEWAVAAEQEAARAGDTVSESECNEDYMARVQEAAQRMADAPGSRLDGYAGPILTAMFRLDAGENREQILELLGSVTDPQSNCQMAAIVLPVDTSFSGHVLEAWDSLGGRSCRAALDCAVGRARWLDEPQTIIGSERTIVFDVFKNRSTRRERRLRLTIYFKPDSENWTPRTR